MILSINGTTRGIGVVDELSGIFLEYEFRDILHLFKGAPLAVFLCIALHSDADGHAFLSYDTLMRETGYGSRSTISDALTVLTEVTVGGHRVLHQYRERLDDGTFVGSNHYRVFPDDNEDDQSTVQSTESVLEVSVNKKPDSSKTLTVQKVDSGVTASHPAIQVYEENGGKFRGARTKLKDGRTVKQKAMEAIAETVGTDQDDLSFWGRVVEGYILQGWSSRSYTTMLEYYTSGALPPNKYRKVRHSVQRPAERQDIEHNREDAKARLERARQKKESA